MTDRSEPYRGRSGRPMAAATALIRFIAALVVVGGVSAPALADEDFVYTNEPVESCLAATATADPADCIGLAANRCMRVNVGGESTHGMGYCVGREADFWDNKLNAVYRQLVAAERLLDKEMADLEATAPEIEPALRQFQRSWIAYRDARCTYEASQWGGGTGAGPAYSSCLMHETARQTLLLKAQLDGRN